MWYLSAENNEKVMYITPGKSEVIIGRSPDLQICNFPITDDSSLSRRHASVTLSSDNSLFVQDLESKYGTFVNDSVEKVINKVQLQHNDIVKFGKLNCVWRVSNIDLISCTSTLRKENLQHLKSILDKIGGLIKNDWDDSCGYLTMPALTLTIKVVFALVQGSHIVTTEFWSKCLECVNAWSPLPDPALFVPEVVETTLNKEVVSFLPNKIRKTLFFGKKCVFFSKRQYETYKKVLLKSSAEPQLLSESKLTKAVLSESNVIVIQYNITSASQETETQKNQISEIVSYLKSKGKRVVPEAEIGLAILFCSLNKYCNPDFNFSNEILKQNSGQNKATNVLAPESQEITNKTRQGNIVLDETIEAVNNSAKRKMSESYDEQNSKRFASQINENKTESYNKRKPEGQEFDILQNPSKKLATEADLSENDLFNFVNPVDNTDKTSERKLNLSKPMKRKADEPTDDDDLFKFLKFNDGPQENAAKICRYEGNNDEEQEVSTVSSLNEIPSITPEEINAMRGKKLEELKNNIQWSSVNEWIKKEPSDDLNQKMNNLDLGSTIVTIKEELIIKKEPVEIEQPVQSVKNFKKFKKVWPVKMQVTIIPKTEMVTHTLDVNTAVYTQA